MTTEPRTPLVLGKKKNSSSPKEMLDLQLTSPSEKETPLQNNTRDSKEQTKESLNLSNDEPAKDDTPSADSSSDTFQTAANITVQKVQSILPTPDVKAVYHVLKVIGFPGHWIRYLMMDKKLNTYIKLCETTQEQWDTYVQEQHTMDGSLPLATEDFPRIIIFQNWCALNSHYEDINLAFKFSREDYNRSWDKQFQLNASPTDPDLPSKSITNSATGIAPNELNETAFQTVTTKNKRKIMKIKNKTSSGESVKSESSNKSNLSNNSFHLLATDEGLDTKETKPEPVPSNVKIELPKQDIAQSTPTYKDKLMSPPRARSLSPFTKFKIETRAKLDLLKDQVPPTPQPKTENNSNKLDVSQQSHEFYHEHIYQGPRYNGVGELTLHDSATMSTHTSDVFSYSPSSGGGE